MHRLLTWLHRELVCLTSHPQSISHTVQRIEELLQTYDMTSFDFQSRIRILVPNHTDHFIHELINYARSPYDIIGYDRFVRYLPRFDSDATEIVTLTSSEEGSDIEFVGTIDATITNISNNATNQNSTSNDNETRINIINVSGTSSSNNNRNDSIDQTGASTSGLSTVTITNRQINGPNLSGDDSDEEEIKTYLRHKPNVTTDEIIRGRTGPSPSTAGGSTEKSDFDSDRTIIIATNTVQSNVASTSQAITENLLDITPKVEPNTQTKTTQEVIDADNGSDSDECLFVCAKKPPHLRTPEYVELNSDSDSDVVFVSSETCQTPLAECSHIDVANDVRKSILSALQSQRNENSTNLRRKRGRPTDTTTTAYTNQTDTTNTYEAKPSTSEAMLQWLIEEPHEEQHSRRISPKGMIFIFVLPKKFDIFLLLSYQ